VNLESDVQFGVPAASSGTTKRPSEPDVSRPGTRSTTPSGTGRRDCRAPIK
jgi:hypothetical protein